MPDAFDAYFSAPPQDRAASYAAPAAPPPAAPARQPDAFDAYFAAKQPQRGPENPFLNAATSAVSTVAEPLANLALRGVNAVGGMSDQDLQRAIRTHPLDYDPSRLSGKIGAGLGMAGAAVGSGGLAPAVFAGMGGEGEYENVEARRAAGQNIGFTQAAQDVAGQAALYGGLGLLGPGAGAAEGGVPGLGQVLGSSIAGGGKMVAVGRAGNAIRQATGVDANPEQNDVENFVTGALYEGVPKYLAGVAGTRNALAEARERAGVYQGLQADYDAAHPKPAPVPETPLSPDQAHVQVIAERLAAQRAQESPPSSPDTTAADAANPALAALRQQHAEGVADADREWPAPEQGEPKELSQHPFLREGEHGPEHPQAGESDFHHFTTPREYTGFQAGLEANRVRDAMGAAELSPERRSPFRQVAHDPEDESRIQQILANGHTFQSPEEAGPNFFQGKAGEQAVREEYGEPPQTPTVEPTPEQAHEEENYGKPWPKVLPKPEATPTQAPTPEAPKPAEAVKPPPPAAPEGETFAQRMIREGREAIARLGSEESGGLSRSAAGGAFLRQDVIPAIHQAVGAVGDTLRAVDKAENLGNTTTPQAADQALAITKALANAKIAGRTFEAQVAPYIPHVPTFEADRAGALHWADQVEATGQSPNPAAQPAVDALDVLMKANAARAKKLGINLEDNDLGGVALSRQFKAPEGARTGGGSVQGDTSTLISQKYTTFSDAYNAAIRKGLVPHDADPLTMQIRAQYEMSRILGLREQLHASEDGGSVAWSPEKTAVPEGHAKIDDPIARQTRRQALPDWVVGKAAGMNYFDAKRFLEDNANKGVFVRPGETLPAGYKYSGTDQPGFYHAGEDTARMWNNATAKGTQDPLAKIPGKIAQAAVKFRYDFSPVHAINGLVQHVGMAMGNLLRNAPRLWGGGEGAVPVNDIFRDLNIFGSRTNEVLSEVAKPGSQSPEVQEIVRRMQEGGNDIKVKSVLDPSIWKPIGDKFASGNWQGGVLSTVGALGKMVKSGTYDTILNRIAATHAREQVEGQMRQGVTAEAGQQAVQDQARVVNRALGRHVDSPEFKNSILKEAGKLMAPAWTYRVGLMKNIASAIAGNPHAQTLVMGTLVNYAIGGAATMAALTLANTGSVQLPASVRDYWNPKTGRKDANGHDERVTFGPAAFGARMIGLGGAKGMADELKGSVNPAITGAVETVENRDYSGNQIRPEGGNFFSNFAKGAGHIARGVLPMSATSQYSSPQGEEQGIGTRIAKELGVGVGHPVTSDAEQVLYDALGANQRGGRNPEQQTKHDNEAKWVQDIRSGNGAQAGTEMRKDTSMSPKEAQNVFSRARAQTGLAGLMGDSRFDAPTLLNAWNAATDEEKAAMKPALRKRINGAEPGSPEAHQQWLALRKAVQ